MAIIIGRPIGGISLNGLEYLLTEEGGDEVMEFESEEAAKQFLLDAGETEENLDDCYVYEKTE